MKVLIVLHHRFELWQAPPWLAERLRKDFPAHEFVHLDTYEGMEQHLANAEVFIGWSLRSEQIAVAKRLRWIHSPAAAVHELLKPEIVQSEVVITNARGIHGPVVAEHVIAQIFALAKRLPSAFRYQQQHKWAQEDLWNERPRPREVAGSTLGLVGLGSIGSEVARRAVALGMRVLAIREHPERKTEGVILSERAPGARVEGPLPSEESGKGHGFSRADKPQEEKGALAPEVKIVGPDSLNQVLAQSDFVVLAAPLTAQTRGLINARRLSLMQPGAYLINVSRGPLIDDAALIAALRERRSAGAALDVFADEPLPADSPYWDLPNVLLTPHTAAVTEKLWERHYAQIQENLKRHLSGRPLLGVVDKVRGY